MIKRDIIDGQEIITLTSGQNYVSVVKTLGGTVYGLALNDSEILFKDGVNELTKNDLFRGRLLFPFNDRIPNGQYRFDDKTHVFPLNCDEDSIHGLIYNRKMDEVDVLDSPVAVSLTLETTINSGEFSGYPFDIGIRITYIINSDGFKMNFTIFNPGDSPAPYAFGWHPYFTFGNNINSSILKFDGDEYYDVDENLYYKGNHYSVKGTDYDFTDSKQIKDIELDIAVSLKNRGEFILNEGDKNIEVDFSREMFPNLQLFIPDDRLSIAIEPITAPSDSFNYPEAGLKIINPGEKHLGYVNVTLKS